MDLHPCPFRSGFVIIHAIAATEQERAILCCLRIKDTRPLEPDRIYCEKRYRLTPRVVKSRFVETGSCCASCENFDEISFAYLGNAGPSKGVDHRSAEATSIEPHSHRFLSMRGIRILH